MQQRPRPTSRAEQAPDAWHEAGRLDAKQRVSFGDDVLLRAEAKSAQARATALLEPPALVAGAGDAVAWDPHTGNSDRVIESFVSTLENPNAIGVDASEQRLRALKSVDALAVGLDAVQTAKARNSFEKMLAHQLAAGHIEAPRLLAASRGERLPPADLVRYVNAAARFMDVYQTGLLTLLKLKTNGQQRVVVQYVSVRQRGRIGDP